MFQVFYSNFDAFTFTLIVVELMNLVVVENTWIKGFTFGSFKARKTCLGFQYDWGGCDIENSRSVYCIFCHNRVSLQHNHTTIEILVLLLQHYFGKHTHPFNYKSLLQCSNMKRTISYHLPALPVFFGIHSPTPYDFHSIYKWEIEFLYCIWISFLSKRNS